MPSGNRQPDQVEADDDTRCSQQSRRLAERQTDDVAEAAFQMRRPDRLQAPGWRRRRPSPAARQWRRIESISLITQRAKANDARDRGRAQRAGPGIDDGDPGDDAMLPAAQATQHARRVRLVHRFAKQLRRRAPRSYRQPSTMPVFELSSPRREPCARRWRPPALRIEPGIDGLRRIADDGLNGTPSSARRSTRRGEPEARSVARSR